MPFNEILSARRKSAKFFQDDITGKFRFIGTIHDLHFLNEFGQMQAVDEAFDTDGTEGFAFKAERLKHRLRVMSNGFRRWFPSYLYPNEYVEIGTPDFWNGSTWQSLTLGTPTRNGNLISWDRPLFTLKVYVLWHRVKIDIVLKSSSTPTRFRFPVGVNGITRQGLNLISTARGVVVGRLDRPFAFDANGEVLQVASSIANGFAEMQVTTTGAAFPVTIDPTLTSQPDGTVGIDTVIIGGGSANTNFGTNVSIASRNSQPAVVLIDFTEADSIPGGANCDDATMSLWTRSTGNAGNHTVNALLASNNGWTEGGATWNKKDGSADWAGSAGASTPDTDYNSAAMGTFTAGGNDGDQNDVPLDTDQVEEWFGGTNNFGLRISNDSGGGDQFYSSDHVTAGQRPQIVVDYTESSTKLFGLFGVGT